MDSQAIFLWFLKVHTLGLLMSTLVYLYLVGFLKIELRSVAGRNSMVSIIWIFLEMLNYESVRITLTSKIGLKVFSSKA